MRALVQPHERSKRDTFRTITHYKLTTSHNHPMDYSCFGERELIERIHELERAQKTRTVHTVRALDDIAQYIDWDNYQDTDEDGEPTRSWTVPQALYCKTQEEIQALGEIPGTDGASDLLAQLAVLLEAMQADHINERVTD